MKPWKSLSDLWRTVRLFAVVTPSDPATMLRLAEALFAGGVRGMEITFRSEHTATTILQIKQKLPEMIIGAGTVLTPDQAATAKDAGADFAVAPGCRLPVIEAAQTLGIPFAPGVATPSEIETALASGCRCLKLFPAELLGGLPYLKAITAPYAHLEPHWLPLGGIGAEQTCEYLAQPEVAAVGGSFLAPARFVENGDWQHITDLAQTTMASLSPESRSSTPSSHVE